MGPLEEMAGDGGRWREVAGCSLEEIAVAEAVGERAVGERVVPEAEEEMANMEAMMVKAAEHAVARAKAAEGSEAASRVSRQDAAARVTGKIRAKERQRQQEELAFDNLQVRAGGAGLGGLGEIRGS